MPERHRSGLAIATILGVVIAAFVLTVPTELHAGEKGPTVFAPASLKTALDAVASDWRKNGGQPPVISYAATSALAKQIEQGAEADIFISADQAWMDYVAGKGLIDDQSRTDLLGNGLVLIAPNDTSLTVTLEPGAPLATMLGEGRLAIANVQAVPAGRYAKAALVSLGIWDDLKTRLAEAENVRAALRLVSRGELPLGIVYVSDAKADPNVKVLARFPEGSHPPIVYPAARLARSDAPNAKAFLDYLRSPEARRRFDENGFTTLKAQ